MQKMAVRVLLPLLSYILLLGPRTFINADTDPSDGQYSANASSASYIYICVCVRKLFRLFCVYFFMLANVFVFVLFIMCFWEIGM